MATNAAATQFLPLSTSREDRGRAIAKLGGIRPLGARYVVPAQTANSNVPTYVVDIVDETCTCPDFETRRVRCKHQEAVLFWLAWEGSVNAETGAVAQPDKKPRKTYGQNWRAYNAAQTSERMRVPYLLHSLCELIEEPARAPGRPGRKPISRRDAIFGLVTKVYSMCSGRRAEADIVAAFERRHLSRVWDHNTLFRAMEDQELTALLIRLIEESAGPLAEIINRAGQIAVDSTGFSTVMYDRWFDAKHGKLRAEHAWIKLHIACDTLTNVVTAVKVSIEADCPVLPELIATTGKRFNVREVSADKAYLSRANLVAIDKIGAVPFIPFKTNSVGMTSKSVLWRRMWAHCSLRADQFFASYHRRSNVESTMGSIKAKLGGSVRSRLPIAQTNEVLAKVLLHNLACIVHAVEEFGIDVSFGEEKS